MRLDSGTPVNARLGKSCDAPERPRYDARTLTGSGVEAEIVLDGKTYHLRITRQGKCDPEQVSAVPRLPLGV